MKGKYCMNSLTVKQHIGYGLLVKLRNLRKRLDLLQEGSPARKELAFYFTVVSQFAERPHTHNLTASCMRRISEILDTADNRRLCDRLNAFIVDRHAR